MYWRSTQPKWNRYIWTKSLVDGHWSYCNFKQFCSQRRLCNQPGKRFFAVSYKLYNYGSHFTNMLFLLLDILIIRIISFWNFRRLFSLVAGWDSEVTFTRDHCFFWIPLVIPHFGGPLGGIIYQICIGHWHQQ